MQREVIYTEYTPVKLTARQRRELEDTAKRNYRTVSQEVRFAIDTHVKRLNLEAGGHEDMKGGRA
jgi:hypothetical protein